MEIINPFLYKILKHLYIFSPLFSKIDKDFKGEGHTGSVTAITKNIDGNILYTCGEDCQVICWSLEEGKQLSNWSVGPEKPSSILYVSNLEAVVVGLRKLLVYSVENHELIQTSIGHASEIHLLTLLEFSNKKNYIVSTSRLDRTACIWKLGKKTKQSREATATLLLEDVAICMMNSKTKDENIIQLVIITRSGVMHIFTLNINE